MNPSPILLEEVVDMERRTLRSPPKELTLESAWRPTDKPLVASEGWLRANGLAPDRRGR